MAEGRLWALLQMAFVPGAPANEVMLWASSDQALSHRG